MSLEAPAISRVTALHGPDAARLLRTVDAARLATRADHLRWAAVYVLLTVAAVLLVVAMFGPLRADPPPVLVVALLSYLSAVALIATSRAIPCDTVLHAGIIATPVCLGSAGLSALAHWAGMPGWTVVVLVAVVIAVGSALAGIELSRALSAPRALGLLDVPPDLADVAIVSALTSVHGARPQRIGEVTGLPTTDVLAAYEHLHAEGLAGMVAAHPRTPWMIHLVPEGRRFAAILHRALETRTAPD